jgi:uncharacterized membrane protein
LKIDSKRSSTLLLGVVLLAALGLRLFHFQQRVLWFDEANSLLIAKASPSRIIDAVLDDTHSPFYYLVLHYWQHVVGGEMGARLLSVFAGVATVAVVYSLGCLLAGRGAGLLGAALMGACPLHVWYSQEIRMYALQTLLVGLSFLFMALALRRERGAFWVGYAICTALSLYAQYVTLFVVIGQNIFVAIYYWKDRRTMRHWLLAQCAWALLFAPWLPGFVTQTRIAVGSSWSPPLKLHQILGFLSLFSGAYLGDSRPRSLSVLITVIVLIVAAMVLWRHRESRQTALLLLLWFIVPVMLLALQSLNQNRFLPRVLVCTTPALALLMGCAAVQAGRAVARAIVAFAVAALLVANVYALRNYYFSNNGWVKSDLRVAAGKIAREFRSGDIIVHSSEFSYRPFEYYLGDGVAQGVITAPVYLAHLFQVTGDGRLPQSTSGFKRIWLVLYPDFAHPGVPEKTRDWMDHHHHFLQPLHNSSMVFVGLYERQDAPLALTGE